MNPALIPVLFGHSSGHGHEPSLVEILILVGLGVLFVGGLIVALFRASSVTIVRVPKRKTRR